MLLLVGALYSFRFKCLKCLMKPEKGSPLKSANSENVAAIEAVKMFKSIDIE